MSKYLAMGVNEFRAMADYNDNYYTLLGEWRAKAIELSEAKDAEMHLRRLLCDLTFVDPTEGSNVHFFGNSKKASKLTMTHVIGRKVDPDAIGACLDVLRETIGPVADELVRWKPELATGEYKKLTDVQQQTLAPAITATPGSPQLKFTDAKD